MFKRVDHVEIIPRDFETTLRFYCDVLGFTPGERFKVAAPPLEEVAYLKLGDTVVELMRLAEALPVSSHKWEVGYHALALEVSDMDAAVSYLAAKGVPTTWGPVNLGTSKRAEIKDPDGLVIELRQWGAK